MELVEIFKAAGLLIVGLLTVTCFAIGFRVFRSDDADYNRNRVKSGAIFSALHGRLSTFHEGKRDHNIAAGLAINTKTNQWTEQGALCDEAIDAVLG